MLQRQTDVDEKTSRIRRAWSIPTYLVALALSSTLPIATVAGFFAYHFVAESSERTRADFEERLRLMRNAVELRIDNIVDDIEVLALAPSLQRGDLASFYAHALATARMRDAFGVVLADRSGQQLINTRLPFGTTLPHRSATEAQDRVFATGRPQISDLIYTATERQPIISIEVPVRVAGEVRYALAIGLSPTYLSGLMDQFVPPNFVGSISDRKGILIARRPLEPRFDYVGKPTIPEVLAHIGEPSALWIQAISRAGVPTYTSLLRSEQTGWTVNMAMPRDVLDGPIRRITFVFAGIAVVALLISLLFARLISLRFLRGLTALEAHVMQLGTTRMIDPVPGPVAEVNRMETVLHRVGTDIAAAETAVERERSLLRATVETMPIGVLLVTADGRVSLVNRKMLSLWGIDELRSLDDLARLEFVHPNGQRYAVAELPISRALDEGVTSEGEEILHATTSSGVRHEIINAAPVRDNAGRIIAALSAAYDVTDLRDAMQRQQVLLDEINHRVKNTLATVQSIARLSLSSAGNVRDYVDAFERRLIALSAAYNLLTENEWQGADVKAIIECTLAPFAGERRIAMSGPPIAISPKLTLALAAAIQELSTNAAKYGSLSVPEGTLAVTWARLDGRIALDWVERGGPPVAKPTRRGFGSRLIQDILAADSGWRVTLDYAPEGLTCRMVIAAAG